MPKFTFSLEGVLRQRVLVEREKQRVVAERQAIVAKLTAELRRMDQQLQSATAEVRQNRLVGRLDLSYLAAHRRYSIAMQRRAMDLARRIASAQVLVEQAQGELVEAARARKAIEKLREKREAEWRADLQRREAAQLDEIGMRIAYENAE